MLNKLVLLMIAAMLMLPTDVRADPDECQEALTSYKTAIGDVSDNLSLYSRCISDSAGHDGCSLEFGNLRSAQDDFETAVAAYESDCQ